MRNILRRSGAIVLLTVSLLLMISSCDVYKHKHTIVSSEEIPPKCFESGYTAGEYCTTCSEYKVGREEIPAIGSHSPKEVDAVPATCGTHGTAAGVACSVCGEVFEGCELITPTEMHQCRKPEKWIWNDDCKQVKVVFRCITCKTTVTGIIPEEGIKVETLGNGVTKYTASVNIAGMFFSDTKEVAR